ncbi:MAG: hypothetical protein ACOCWG_06105, partial [bacterium]
SVWHHTSMNFSNFTELFYSQSSGFIDFVQPLILFIVSRFTDNHNILFGFYGLIFGFFYSRNIWYLFDHLKEDDRFFNLVLILTFSFVVGFWNINGFRMWTAAHVFFFGAIRYLHKKNIHGLFIAFCSMFFHFSFLLPALIFALFVVIGNRLTIFYWFFIFSFFLAQVDLAVIRDTLLNYLPSVFYSKIMGYTHEGYAELVAERAGKMVWYARLYGQFLYWMIVIFLSFIYFSGLRALKKNNPLRILLGFIFLFYGFVNLLSHIPSMGRFYSVANLFALTFLFFYLQKVSGDSILNKIKVLTIPVQFFFCIVSLRLAFDTIGIISIFGNPFFALFTENNFALIQFLR